MTEKFVDLRSRERNLLAAEEGLLKLYNRAEDVEDALSIQRELTSIRGQVEETQGRIQYLEQSTASSQIFVGIRLVAEAPESPAWNPALVAAKAWNASLCVLQGLASAVMNRPRLRLVACAFATRHARGLEAVGQASESGPGPVAEVRCPRGLVGRSGDLGSKTFF